MAAARVKDRVRHYGRLAMETYWSLRRRRPWFDHVVRSYERYADRRGDQLAASVTYFAFLSFFPLLALAFSVLGYVAAFDLDARASMEEAIDSLLPGIAAQLPLEEVANARTGAGIIGLLGLLYTGLGAIAALREALHVVWMKSVSDGPNFILAKLLDVVIVVVLGLCLLGSVALTSVAQAATGWLLAWVELDGSLVAVGATRLLGLVIAVGVDLVIFIVLFSRLSGSRRPWRLMWRGALLAAVGFEILKSVGALLVGSTLSNPVYASFAVVVGLLVWINIVMRFLLFSAAWTATWLPVPPPYEGSVPLNVPVTTTRDEPARLGVRDEHGAHAAATLPARPTGEMRAASRARTRRAVRLAALRRSAPVAAVGAGALAFFLWWRSRKSRIGAGVIT